MAGSSSSSTSSRRTLKLLVARDQSGSEHVVSAEAEKGAADYLFSLLSWSMPVNTLINVLSRNPMVGCVRNLYDSVETLPSSFICHRDARAARDALLRPTDSSSRPGGFVLAGVNYVVRDDLSITPPSNITAGLTMLNNRAFLREMVVPLGDVQGAQILNKSMVTRRVLTHVYLRGPRALTAP
ncbi:hypothetical protein ACQ4PT_003754 [Festuca glaucescens]